MNAQFPTGPRDCKAAWLSFLSTKALGRLALIWGLFAGCMSFVFGADTSTLLVTHTFTDQEEGRVLNAAIISVSGTDVYLQHVDGSPFKVKIAVFVEKDRTYIRQWAQQHLDVVGFDVSVIPNKSSDAQAPPWQNFKVSLKNPANKIPVGLHMDYIIFQLPTSSHSSSGPLTRLIGSLPIKESTDSGDLTLETDQVSGSGAKLAIWIRVYTSTGAILQEWKSSAALTSQKWDTDRFKPILR